MSNIDQFDFDDLPVGAVVEVIIRDEVFETLTVEDNGDKFFRCGEGGWLRMNNVVTYYGVQAEYRRDVS